MLDAHLIRDSIAELEAARLTYQRQMQEATARLDVADKELRLLRELLRVREGPREAEPSTTRSDSWHGDGAGEAAPTPAIGAAGSASRVTAEVISILDAAGEPMPIRVIYEALKERQIALPGQGRMVNVIAAINRSEAIVRPARGVYALTAWGMVDGQNEQRARRGRAAQSRRTAKSSRGERR
jgi:hypothetical protein